MLESALKEGTSILALSEPYEAFKAS